MSKLAQMYQTYIEFAYIDKQGWTLTHQKFNFR